MKKNIAIVLLIVLLIISVKFNMEIYEDKRHEQSIRDGDIQHAIAMVLVGVPRDHVITYLESVDEIDAGELKEVMVVTETTHGYARSIIGFEFYEVTQYFWITYRELNKLLELVEEGAEQEEIDKLRNHIIERQQKSIDTYFKIEEYMEENGYKGRESLFWYKNYKSEIPEVTEIINEGLW